MKLKKDGTPSRQGEGGGNPPKYANEEALTLGIEKYMRFCIDNKEVPNKAGLCFSLHIGKDAYLNYKKKYADAIKRVELWIENQWISRLQTQSPVGAIFYLKNAFREDYRDRYENDVTTGGKPLPIYGGKSTHLQGHNSDSKDISTHKAD